MVTLTVFTPAYNRAHTLKRTYESLCHQTCKDFCWLIIDDGSTDNTRQVVEEWIQDGLIRIRYIYQQNQGMHGAHNTAYRNIDTILNVCIDSDDYMPNDAVESILDCWQEHNDERIAGIIGLDITTDGDLIGTKFPSDMKTTTVYGFYEKGGKGDKKMVYRTDVITRYPEYPLFEGEKYVGLGYKYMLIDQDYEMVTLNHPLVIVDYQAEGSSYSMYRQYWNNPYGFAFFRKAEMKIAKKLIRRLQICTHYVSSSIIGKNWRFVSESPEKLLTLLCIPSGFALYLLIWAKVKSNSKMKKVENMIGGKLKD